MVWDAFVWPEKSLNSIGDMMFVTAIRKSGVSNLDLFDEFYQFPPTLVKGNGWKGRSKISPSLAY